MKLKLILFSLILSSSALYSQKKTDDPVIFCFGKNKVTQSELERGYLRNKDLAKNKPTDAEIEDYLKLYQNFKLKVQDAKDRKMDTLPEYIKELADYRRQLAKKYLSDSAVTEELVREAYDRTTTLVNASHILILSSYSDSPADTLKAYQKIENIRNQLVKNEISFSQAAMSSSEDPSAKSEGSLGYQGNLGWFSAFQMLYEFEDMAYKTDVGAISQIFRTRYGYHILKVNDRKKSEGERKISQIVIRRVPNESAEDAAKVKARIDAIHQLLTNGAAWDTTLLKYTEDQNARYNGGVTEWFFETSTDKLPREVIEEAYKLDVKGSISNPVSSRSAWHIIFLLDKKAVPTFAERENKLRSSLSQDSRSFKSTEATIDRIKLENGYSENKELLNKFIEIAANPMLNGEWATSSLSNPKDVLFTIGSKKVSLAEFSDFVAANQSFNPKPKSGNAVLINYFKTYSDNAVMSYEDNNLETKYPQFASIYQDFKDGILFFNINSLEVWNKPMTDTAGLRKFYTNNLDSFVWKERVEVLNVSAADHGLLHQAENMLSSGMHKDSVMNALNKSNPLNILIERGLYERGMNRNADMLLDEKEKWANSNTLYFKELPKQNGIEKALVAVKLLPSSAKSFDDARGQVSGMFQNAEEQKWLSGLRKKYKIKVQLKAYNAFKAKMLSL